MKNDGTLPWNSALWNTSITLRKLANRGLAPLNTRNFVSRRQGWNTACRTARAALEPPEAQTRPRGWEYATTFPMKAGAVYQISNQMVGSAMPKKA